MRPEKNVLTACPGEHLRNPRAAGKAAMVSLNQSESKQQRLKPQERSMMQVLLIYIAVFLVICVCIVTLESVGRWRRKKR